MFAEDWWCTSEWHESPNPARPGGVSARPGLARPVDFSARPGPAQEQKIGPGRFSRPGPARAANFACPDGPENPGWADGPGRMSWAVPL